MSKKEALTYKQLYEESSFFIHNIKPFLVMTDKEIEDLPDCYKTPLKMYKEL